MLELGLLPYSDLLPFGDACEKVTVSDALGVQAAKSGATFMNHSYTSSQLYFNKTAVGS